MNLHPLMAQALRPFAPAERLEAQVANATRLFQPPRCPRGFVSFEYQVQDMDTPVICHLEYEPAERGSREHGLQMEPDYPAQMTLHSAYIRDVDIYPLLTAGQVEDIEAEARDTIEGSEWEAGL